jgi:hypothetical protein
MRLFCFDVKMLSFAEVAGIDRLDATIGKFRELRDDYRSANRDYFGDYLFALLDDE